MIDLKGGVKFGDYTLQEYKGEGTTSQVWSARNNGSDIALKIFAPKTNLDNLSKGLLREEFEKTKSLKSDYLLVPTSYFEHQDVPALAMPLCEGSMWQELINRLKLSKRKTGEQLGVLFEEKTIAKLINHISSALKFLHEKRMVHNDVKPANILFQNLNSSEKSKFYLTDFGITKETRDTILRQTKTQNSLTFAYASPEVLKGGRGTFQSDIFSLGTSVFELINGTDLDVPLGQILNNNGEVPNINPNYSNRLINLLTMCLEKAPEDRVSVSELQDYSQFYLSNGHWPDALETILNDSPEEVNDNRDTVMNYSPPVSSDSDVSAPVPEAFVPQQIEDDFEEESSVKSWITYLLIPLLLAGTYFTFKHFNSNEQSSDFLSEYDKYLQPVNGMRCVVKNGNYGVIDSKGNIVRPLEYKGCINRINLTPAGIELIDNNQKSTIVN